MVDTALDTMTVPTRDELVDKWRTHYRARSPDTDPADPQLEADASVAVDNLLPLIARVKTVADFVGFKHAQGMPAVSAWGEREGITGPNPAIGANGYVEVDTSIGGSTITNGETLVYENTGFIYAVAQATGAIADADRIFITGVSTGPVSDLPPGATLKWVSGATGRGPSVTVVAKSDGSGLSGGQQEETAPLYKERIHRAKNDRADSGNDAEYRAVCAATPGLSIQQVFTYPGIRGTGTIGITFTLVPVVSGGARIPDSGQLALAQAYVTDRMPADDGALWCLLAEVNADIAAKVTWDSSALGWFDLTPWPRLRGGTEGGTAFTVTAASNATHFTISGNSGEPPTVGQTIAVFDAPNLAFRKKRVLSFTGGSTGPWPIVVDTTFGSSDTTYTPVVGQRVMPWSESLPALLPKLCEYFDNIGPGEQSDYRFDSGRRMKRQPPAPKEWPHSCTDKGLGDAFDVDVLENAVVVEKPAANQVGTPGVSSKILRLRWLSIFPE